MSHCVACLAVMSSTTHAFSRGSSVITTSVLFVAGLLSDHDLSWFMRMLSDVWPSVILRNMLPCRTVVNAKRTFLLRIRPGGN